MYTYLHTYQKFAAKNYHVLVSQSFLCPVLLFSTVIYVQLETSSFEVEEETGFVEICVDVSTDEDIECPIEFDAGITLSSREDTAGTVQIIIYMKVVQKNNI